MRLLIILLSIATYLLGYFVCLQKYKDKYVLTSREIIESWERQREVGRESEKQLSEFKRLVEDAIKNKGGSK